MATVLGRSGAWGAIADELAALGCIVGDPGELSQAVSSMCEHRDELIASHRQATLREVQQLSLSIGRLRSETRGFARLFLPLRVRRLRNAVDALFAADAAYPAHLDQTVARVDGLRGSPELAGAVAELEVIGHLSVLPECYAVFSDVRLSAERVFRFDGKPLLSAQLDHVVLAPDRVWVVETKRWSQRFVDSGAYHDPFDQVRRAGYLCYKELGRVAGPVRVDSLIATQGRLPGPTGAHVRVVTPGRLAAHILKSAGPPMPRADFESAFEFLWSGTAAGNLTMASSRRRKRRMMRPSAS
jgi:hypothetical protein